MSGVKLSFSDWVYPTKHPKDQVSAWSPNGLFAHAVGEVLTIYAHDRGVLSPLLSWKPFEHDITAMAWYDGSMCAERSLPVIVLGSQSGRVSVFDLSAKKIIAGFKVSKEYATAIQWSPFCPRTFYVGTAAGEVICCDLVLDRLSTFSQKWTVKTGFQVDFISVEPRYGDALALACTAGNIMFVENIDTAKPTVFGNSLSMCDKGKNSISAMEYFRYHPGFVMIVTKLGTILYSVQDEVSIPLLPEPDLRAVYQLSVSGNLMIAVRDDALDLYQIGKETVKVQELYVAGHNNNTKNNMQIMREIRSCHFSNNKVLLLTASWVLLTIELKNRKLFISRYTRMLDAKPLDWSFWRGGMAIVTDNGKLLVTRMISLMTIAPNSPTQKRKRPMQKKATADEPTQVEAPKPAQVEAPKPAAPTMPPVVVPAAGELNESRRRTRRPVLNAPEQQPQAPNSTAIPSMSGHVEFGTLPAPAPAAHVGHVSSGGVSTVALPKMLVDEMPMMQLQLMRQRRKSATEQKIADQTIQQLMQLANQRKVMEAPTELVSQLDKTKEKSVMEHGNSRAFLWCFNICSGPLQHVDWISAARILVWGTEAGPNDTTKNYAYIIDCRTRKLISLINKQIDALNLPITSVTVSENKHTACLVLNHKIATVMTLMPEVRQIGSFPFSTKIVAAFSPVGDQIVFLDHKGVLRFTTFIDAKKATPISIETATSKTVDFKKEVPTCMLWRVNKDCGQVLIVGMESGNVIRINLATAAISNITVMKNSVSMMVKYGKGIVVVDDKGSTALIGVTVDCQFPSSVKNITCVSPTTFLVRGAGEGRIRAVQNTGKYLPLYSPIASKCALMKAKDNWLKTIRELEPSSYREAITQAGELGMNLVRMVLESVCFPNTDREGLILLRDLIQDRKLGSLAMRISLLIGDREQARQLCLSGIGEGPSDPVFSILKSTLFDCTPKMEYIEAASAQLLAKGEVQHALDLWMILDDWNTAIEKLVKLDDFKKSVTILSALKQDEDSITQTVARKFIAHRSTGIGLRLLGRAKSFSDIVNIFENLGEAEQAGFLKTCSQLDPHL